METGDGLLARLDSDARDLDAWEGLLELSEIHGNGRIEVTSRGSVQLRGLHETTAEPFARAAGALGFSGQTAPVLHQNVDVADALEPEFGWSDWLNRIRQALHRAAKLERLPAKFSVVLDAGFEPWFGALSADVRLEIVPARRVNAPLSERWVSLAVGGGANSALTLGSLRAAAVEVVLPGLIAALSRRERGESIGPWMRGPAGDPVWGALKRHLQSPTLQSRPRLASELALGLQTWTCDTPESRPIEALLVGLPLGRSSSRELRELLAAARRVGARRVKPLPDHVLALWPLHAPTEELTQHARALGLLLDAEAPLRRIHACVGAPGCASAHLETLPLAEQLAQSCGPGLRRDRTLYLAGCSKRCGRPKTAHVEITGTLEGCEIHMDGELRRREASPSGAASRVRAMLDSQAPESDAHV